MSERAGLHRIFENSRVYAAFQNGLVRTGTWERLQPRFLAAITTPGARVLDIGCGPATFLSNFPSFPPDQYTGLDPNPAYIDTAKAVFPQADLHVGTTSTVAEAISGTFDLAVAFGVLHHVDDAEAIRIAEFARDRLCPGGTFFALDPVFVPGQHPIARRLAASDRGQHVRDLDGYRELVAGVFGASAVTADALSGLLRVPYNHSAIVARLT